MYQRLQENLKKIQDFLKDAGDAPSLPVASTHNRPESATAPPSLTTAVQALKHTWQQHQQQHPQHPKWQALNTEMHKQLRLMDMDMQFLRTARQPATRQQRQQQVLQRVTMLLEYCEAGIKLSEQSAPGPDTEC